MTAGLTTDANSGPVEGAVNQIKMLERQMFGRAGFPLLRNVASLTSGDMDGEGPCLAVTGEVNFRAQAALAS